MSDTLAVSHGRGGTGNIGKDDTLYVDGGIRREGDPAASGVAYSTGRGGASNIASPAADTAKGPADDDIVPEVTKVLTSEGPYHGGRGGEGNVVTTETPKKKPHRAIASWLKLKLVTIARTAGKRKVTKPTVKVDEPKDEPKKEEAAKKEEVKKEEVKKEEKKEEKKEDPKQETVEVAKEEQKEAPKQEEKTEEQVTTQESVAGAEKPLEQVPTADATVTATAAPAIEATPAPEVEPAATQPEGVKA